MSCWTYPAVLQLTSQTDVKSVRMCFNGWLSVDGSAVIHMDLRCDLCKKIPPKRELSHVKQPSWSFEYRFTWCTWMPHDVPVCTCTLCIWNFEDFRVYKVCLNLPQHPNSCVKLQQRLQPERATLSETTYGGTSYLYMTILHKHWSPIVADNHIPKHRERTCVLCVTSVNPFRKVEMCQGHMAHSVT